MAVVTVRVDAASCPETGAAGWAAWCRKGDRIESHAAPLRARAGSEISAGVAAAANGVAFAAACGLALPGDHVILEVGTDAVRRALEGGNGLAPDLERLADAVRATAARRGLSLRIASHRGSAERSLLSRRARRHLGVAPVAAQAAGSGAPSNPARIARPVSGGALAALLVLAERGLCERRHVVAAVLAVAARERGSVAGWARCCEGVGLAIRGSWEADPARAERAASVHRAEDAVAVLTGRRSGLAALRRAVESASFPDDPRSSSAALPFLADALARGGFDGLVLEEGNVPAVPALAA